MSVVIEVIAPRLIGPALILALAIIVKGYQDVGDGFSAGVILALAIALRYIALGVDRAEAGLPILRHTGPVAVAGILVALASGFFGVLLGDPPFTHAPGPGEEVVHLGTLELMTAVSFDLGLFALVTSALVAVMHALARLVEGGES